MTDDWDTFQFDLRFESPRLQADWLNIEAYRLSLNKLILPQEWREDFRPSILSARFMARRQSRGIHYPRKRWHGESRAADRGTEQTKSPGRPRTQLARFVGSKRSSSDRDRFNSAISLKPIAC